jgi:hypothetical protein
MKELSMKFLSSASVAIIILTVSACSYKHDHKQKHQSFSDRRDPKENTIAASGMLGSKKSKKVSVDYSSSNTPAPASQQPVASAEVTQQSPDTKAPAESGSFFERLMGIGSNKAEKQSSAEHVNYAYNNADFTRMPQENGFEIARINGDEFTSQGSRQGKSYFDIAEPIAPAPVHDVKVSTLAAINISSSLINDANAADEPAKLPALPQPIVANENKAMPSLPALDLPSAGGSPAAQVNKDVKAAPVVATTDGGAHNQAPVKPMPPVPAMPQSLDMDTKALATQPPSVNTPQQPTMVKIPELPSNEQMKKEISNQPMPQLNAVPAQPQVPVIPQVHEQVKAVTAQPTHQPTPQPVEQKASVPVHVVQPPLGHPTVHTPEHKTPESVTHTQVENKPAVETKAENAAPAKPKKIKRPVKKAAPLKAEPDPVDFNSIQTLDNSVIVNENGHYVTKKFLGSTNN